MEFIRNLIFMIFVFLVPVITFVGIYSILALISSELDIEFIEDHKLIISVLIMLILIIISGILTIQF